MDLFEALEFKAWQNWTAPEGYRVSNGQVVEAVKVGISAAIQALKEMMVGEAVGAKVYQYLSRYLPGQERTDYIVETESGKWRCLFTQQGHHGTDGEEVMVLVIRLNGKETI